MSRIIRYNIFTEKIFELQEAIESGNKEKFVQLLEKDSLDLRNSSCGDAYLQQFFLKVLCEALEKFI